MGCTDSIMSAMVAKTTDPAKTTQKNSNSRVQPAPLRCDKLERDNAREKRRLEIAERHAKKQSMAKVMSENAMAEKERLSTSTWRSYRSGGGIVISVRGSDGTASPDIKEEDFPDENNPADINANDMQIRTMELPNQIADQSSAANQKHSTSEINDMTQNSADGGMNEHSYNFEERLQNADQKESLLNNSNSSGNMPQICINDEPRTIEQAQEQSKVDGEQIDIAKEKKKKKRKGKHKEVKFTVQVSDDHAESDLGEGRKSTSQGR